MYLRCGSFYKYDYFDCDKFALAEFLYDTLADFINKLTGNTKRTTTHIVPSARPSNPLTVKE